MIFTNFKLSGKFTQLHTPNFRRIHRETTEIGLNQDPCKMSLFFDEKLDPSFSLNLHGISKGSFFAVRRWISMVLGAFESSGAELFSQIGLSSF